MSRPNRIFPKSIFRVIRSFFDRNSPVFAHLFLTKRCNLRCMMCNVWETRCQELDTERMKMIIDRLDRLGVAIIQLTGGEPFLRPDLGEIASYAAKMGIIVQVSTNGTLPLSYYQKVLKMPINAIGVSLHSYRASTHERINGLPGSWEKAVKTIRFLKESGINVYVCSVISSLNFKEAKDIVRYCISDLKVEVGLQPAVMGTDEDGYAFRGKNPELGSKLEMADIEKEMRDIPMIGVTRTRHFMKNAFKILAGNGPAWDCEAGRLFLAVMPDGQVGLCQDILGEFNLLDEDYFDRLHGREFKDFCKVSVEKCKNCVYACYYDLHNMFHSPLAGLDLWIRNRSHVRVNSV
jgi:MoaA/NifB/PqqE/SkfB family radical SAM enzyme